MNDERLNHWYSSSKDVSSRLAETIEILDDITRLTSDWVWSLDDEFNINFISDRIFDSCGIPAEEVLGTRLTELGSFIKSPSKSHQPDFQKPFRDVPFQVITRAETTRNLLISGLPVFSFETRQFTGVRGIARDITDQIQAETSSNRLHSAIDEISEVFILCDKNDEIITANRSARTVNGAFVDKLAPGTPFSEFVTSVAESGLVSDARGREQASIAERLEFHRNPGRPFEVRREDGTHYLIHEDRLPDGSTATFSVDITERKQMERSLQEIVKRQHEFATDVAHELRTPMAVLRANLDSLPDSEIVNSLKTDVDAVSRMVEELVAESRFEELEIVTDERADLLAIAKAVATYVAPLAIRHDRMIEVTGVDSPTMVWG